MSTFPSSSHLISDQLPEREGAIKTNIGRLADPVNSPAVLAEQLGLVGCFESGVGDLGQQHSQYLKDKVSSSNLTL